MESGSSMKPTNTNEQEIERHLGDDAPGREASSEQSADLAALQAMAAPEAPAAGVPAAQAQEAQGPSAQAVQLAAVAVGVIRPLICYAVPALRTAPEALWEPLPLGVAGVLDHYDLGEHFDNPWVGLAMASAPLAAFAVMESAKAPPKEKPAERIEGPDLSAPIPAQAVGQKTVTFGALAA